MIGTEIFKIDASWAEKIEENESAISNDANCRYCSTDLFPVPVCGIKLGVFPTEAKM